MPDPVQKSKNERGYSTGKYVTIITIIGVIVYVVFAMYFRTYIHFKIFTNILIFFHFIICFALIGIAAGLARSYKKALKK